MGNSNNEAAGLVIGIMMLVATAILIMQKLFALFLILFVIFLTATFISFFIELFFRDHHFIEWYEYVTFYLFVALIVSGLGMTVSHAIGYGLGGTTLGQASLEVYYEITGAEEELSKAIDDVVEENCKTLDERNCKILRATVESAKTLQEVTNKANDLKQLSQTVGFNK